MSVVGVDGCRSGWIAVELSDENAVRARYLERIDAVADAFPDAAAIAIDIPIGLPVSGRRRADTAARAFVGVRRNSVFFIPVRAAIEAPTHAEASAASEQATGFGASQQAYALRHKILEVEAWLPSARCPVHESHPEVSFTILLGAPATASKKTWSGFTERRRGLAGAGVELEGLDEFAGSKAAVDDMVDAAVLAWTARRLVEGTARVFPDPAADGAATIWA